MFRLFLYGMLLDEGMLARRSGEGKLPARRVPATLTGWERVGLRDGRYPTLRRRRTGIVAGTIVTVPARAFGRLTVYEGPSYRLTRVVVTTRDRKTAAFTWIAPGGTSQQWKE